PCCRAGALERARVLDVVPFLIKHLDYHSREVCNPRPLFRRLACDRTLDVSPLDLAFWRHEHRGVVFKRDADPVWSAYRVLLPYNDGAENLLAQFRRTLLYCNCDKVPNCCRRQTRVSSL